MLIFAFLTFCFLRRRSRASLADPASSTVIVVDGDGVLLSLATPAFDGRLWRLRDDDGCGSANGLSSPNPFHFRCVGWTQVSESCLVNNIRISYSSSVLQKPFDVRNAVCLLTATFLFGSVASSFSAKMNVLFLQVYGN